VPEPHTASRAQFEAILSYLDSAEAAGLEHFELETWLAANGQELLRKLMQEHFDLRALREVRLPGVIDAQGVLHASVEPEHARTLTTTFGDVVVRRLAYRHRGTSNLHPADAALNLPQEQYSHRLRQLAAIEATRGSFADAAAAITRSTGQRIGKRQVEELTHRAAVDVEQFYAQAPRQPVAAQDVLVLSADGKGIVMRSDALRPATRAAAAAATTKLATRLSKGEKRNRKRMAEVGAVYDAAPVVRKPSDILATADNQADRPPAPQAKNKWLTVSVLQDAKAVIARIFTEADRRDPGHRRPWLALVDGNRHQLDCIRAEAKARGVSLTIVIDFIHVLEYLWKAAWSFYAEGQPEAEAWVKDKALAVLEGKSAIVAAAIRRKATCLQLAPERRKGADTCADYLLHHRDHLDYPTALKNGWPIATGVIEGACRHLVKDRMDITGARWGLQGAEAVLKLRALCANGDFNAYWDYHRAQERHRLHEVRYADGRLPLSA
jgi:hypothetical protein